MLFNVLFINAKVRLLTLCSNIGPIIYVKLENTARNHQPKAHFNYSILSYAGYRSPSSFLLAGLNLTFRFEPLWNHSCLYRPMCGRGQSLAPNSLHFDFLGDSHRHRGGPLCSCCQKHLRIAARTWLHSRCCSCRLMTGLVISHAWMIIGGVAGAILGGIAYSKTPAEKALRISIFQIFELSLCQGLPAVIAVCMAGTALHGSSLKSEICASSSSIIPQ